MCEDKNIDILKVAIPLPGKDDQLVPLAQSALRAIRDSNHRIHFLIAARSDQVTLLDVIRYRRQCQLELTSAAATDSILILG